MDSTQTQNSLINPEDVEQEERILHLQDLIEENIEVEHQIEMQTIDKSIKSIDNIMKRANEIVKGYEERRTNSTELVLDTELLRRNHEVVGKVIQYNSNFTDAVFTAAINDVVFKDNNGDWDALCGMVFQLGTPFFTNASMLTFVDVKPKVHIPKQRAQRRPRTEGEEKRPKMSDKLERKDEGAAAVSSTFKQIKAIYKADRQPIPYYKLIIDPDNLMDTVQNALQLSFLAKEKLIIIENGTDGLPHVRVSGNANKEAAKESAQAIGNLDIHICKKFTKHYNIKKPMLARPKYDEHADEAMEE